MRIQRLRGLAVVDPDTACQIGSVTDYWIDPAAGRLAALTIRPIDADLPQRVAGSRVAHVGQHAVMLAPSDAARAALVGPVPERWLDRQHLERLIVYTDTGDRLGRVNGAEIDPRSLAISAFELGKPWWRRWLPGARQILPSRVAWCGREVLVVRTAEAAKLRPVGEEEGVAYRVSQGWTPDGKAGPNGKLTPVDRR